jgi:hypothetical protein
MRLSQQERARHAEVDREALLSLKREDEMLAAPQYAVDASADWPGLQTLSIASRDGRVDQPYAGDSLAQDEGFQRAAYRLDLRQLS